MRLLAKIILQILCSKNHGVAADRDLVAADVSDTTLSVLHTIPFLSEPVQEC